jgi:inner membrane protein YidH
VIRSTDAAPAHRETAARVSDPQRPDDQIDPDSRARTHLANERTYLAWFRTGLTLIALGIAAAQFLDQDIGPGVPLASILATILVTTGVLFDLIGMRRYFEGREHIEALDYRPADLSVRLTTAAAVLVGLLAIAFVWLLRIS